MKVLAFDPGHTTGFVCIDWPHDRQIKPREDIRSYIVDQGQFPFHEDMKMLLDEHQPTIVVFEKFTLYGHRAQQKIGSDFPTVQVIGILKLLLDERDLPWYDFSAQQAKGFYTDKRLKEHNVWFTNMRHCRDSIRHAMCYIDFGKKRTKKGFGFKEGK